MAMISVAEESNNLDSVLNDISDNLDRQTWRQLDLMVRLLEPIMLLILAGLGGYVYFVELPNEKLEEKRQTENTTLLLFPETSITGLTMPIDQLSRVMIWNSE